MAGDIGIGRLIDGDAHRDAIHVAVCPAVAGEVLLCGQRVTLTRDHGINTDEMVARAAKEDSVGIVDPFLGGRVEALQRFYVFLNPGSISSLRHEWTHPELDDKPAARRWIESYATFSGLNVDHLLSLRRLPHDINPEFFAQYEELTGKDGKSIAAIMCVADDAGLTFEELMEGAKRFVEYGETMSQGERWEGFQMDAISFWDAYEALTGTKGCYRGSFFSCSC
jgi:hypothetical protein